MARYLVPEVLYQPTMSASTAIKISRFKSLTWQNKVNNNANFTLRLPIDSHLPVTPVLGAYIRVNPSDVIMQIEKTEKICDADHNLWWEISGRPTMGTDDQVRQAQNEGRFFRYVYNGINANTFVTKQAGVSVAQIGVHDILHSSNYGDNLGGFTEMVSPFIPGFDASTWGTIVTSQPKPVVTTVNVQGIASVTVPTASGGQNTGTYTFNDLVSITSHSVFVSDTVIQANQGNSSGPSGRIDKITAPYSWFTNDVTEDVVVHGPSHGWTWYSPTGGYVTGSSAGQVILRKRTVTMRTDSQMQTLMNSLLASGTIPGRADVQAVYRNVIGGHTGYKCAIKSRGDVYTRYKVDYNVGDTITINDTRLGVVFTGVVSGATETIDSSGYNVDIELGTLGATVEQRINRTI